MNNSELGGPRTSWIDEILLPHLCIVCFITFLAIYQGKFSAGATSLRKNCNILFRKRGGGGTVGQFGPLGWQIKSISIFATFVVRFFVTLMTGHQKDNFLVSTALHGGPWGGRRGPFLAQKSAFFYATPTLPQFLGLRRVRLNRSCLPHILR